MANGVGSGIGLGGFDLSQGRVSETSTAIGHTKRKRERERLRIFRLLFFVSFIWISIFEPNYFQLGLQFSALYTAFIILSLSIYSVKIR